jgi:hypothetical protein
VTVLYPLYDCLARLENGEGPNTELGLKAALKIPCLATRTSQNVTSGMIPNERHTLAEAGLSR